MHWWLWCGGVFSCRSSSYLRQVPVAVFSLLGYHHGKLSVRCPPFSLSPLTHLDANASRLESTLRPSLHPRPPRPRWPLCIRSGIAQLFTCSFLTETFRGVALAVSENESNNLMPWLANLSPGAKNRKWKATAKELEGRRKEKRSPRQKQMGGISKKAASSPFLHAPLTELYSTGCLLAHTTVLPTRLLYLRR